MTAKRQALTDYCAGILTAHQAGLKAEQRHRRETEMKATRRERIAVMGDPAYYLEVLETGPTERTAKDEQGRFLGGIHRFQVTLYLQYADDEDYDNSSQSRFDDMVESTDESAIGLLPALRCLGLETLRAASGEVLRVRQPSADAKDVVPLDEQGTEAAHLLTFTIAVEDLL